MERQTLKKKYKKLGLQKRSPIGTVHHIFTTDGIITVEREPGGKIRIIAPQAIRIQTIPLDKRG